MNSFMVAVERWLKSKYINAPTDWLEACIDWIKDENGGTLPPQQRVNELVFEQWLLSDLHELGTKCLPDEVVQASKYHLNGTFALQIDYLVDISQSCYSQLQKVKGTENANVDVSAETHKPWEPKPSRMLKMMLTDGTLDVQGMEYRSIPCLTSAIKPGCKILIKGPMLCRHGMVMLKGENVSVLGGEVDTLIESHTTEDILKRSLEHNISNADKCYKQEFEGGPTQSNKVDVKPSVQQNRIQNVSHDANIYTGNRNQGMRPQVKTEPVTQDHVDEFDEDLPLDALLDDMEDFTDDQLNTDSKSNIRTETNGNNSTINNQYRHSDRQVNKRPDSFLKISSSRDSSRNMCSSNQTINKIDSSESRTKISQRQEQSNVQNRPFSDCNNVQFLDDDFDDNFDFSDINYCRTSKEKNDNNTNKLTGSCVINSKKRQLVSPVETETCNKRRPFLSDFNNDNFKDDMQDLVPHEQFDEVRRKRPLFSSPSGGTCNVKEERLSPACIDRLLDDSGATSSKTKLSLPHATKTIKTEISSSPEVNLNYDPWTYLSVVKKSLATQQLICFKVKAYISTLTGKLECVDGKRWSLPVKINDGTDSMDVDLSNKILADMIGFTAEQSQVLRKLAKTDIRIKEKLAQGIKKCQQRLVELLCIMEIEISPHIARPEVTSLVDITKADISVLADRLTKSIEK